MDLHTSRGWLHCSIKKALKYHIDNHLTWLATGKPRDCRYQVLV